MAKTRAPRGRGRTIVLWLGVAMMLAGASLLGYVAWQFWGTNWVAHREQEKVTGELRERWARAAEPAALQPREVPRGQASALIRIPRFGSSYVMPVLEGTSDQVLASGFGHFSDSADPGEVGNYALAAHRVTHGEPLRRMPDLRPGDKVVVETVDHRYTYALDTNPNDLVVAFTEGWVVDPLPKNPDAGGVQPDQAPGQRLITLTTCSELFHTDDRMIAFGHLVQVDPLSR